MIKSQSSILEITVISAHGIKSTPSTLLSGHPRPFVTIAPTATCPPPCNSHCGERCHVYRTRVDDQGGVNPTWGEKFQIPLDPTFFAGGPSAGLYLQLFGKRALLGRGPAHLGWCHVPSTDILDGPGQIRNLSYRVRAKDGSRGEGIVNIAVRLVGSVPDPGRPDRPLVFGGAGLENSATFHTALGVPVRMCQTMSHDSLSRFTNANNEI